MQRVLHQDVVALARCLLRVPKGARAAYAARCVEVAAKGDQWRRQTGRVHPLFGDGTLQSACLGLPRGDEKALDDPDYARCWVTAIYAVLDRCSGSTGPETPA